jgi:hypothetical protein
MAVLHARAFFNDKAISLLTQTCLSEVNPMMGKIGETEACLASMERSHQAHADEIQPAHGMHAYFFQYVSLCNKPIRTLMGETCRI